MNRDVYPKFGADELGWLSREEMTEIDRVMIEDLQIELIMMMENAGRNLAKLVLDLAFDHERILHDAIDRAADELDNTDLATAFVGPTFTLSELQNVYEALGSRL
jgi:hypothetical protein